jgi:hypothetical protein
VLYLPVRKYTSVRSPFFFSAWLKEHVRLLGDFCLCFSQYYFNFLNLEIFVRKMYSDFRMTNFANSFSYLGFNFKHLFSMEHRNTVHFNLNMTPNTTFRKLNGVPCIIRGSDGIACIFLMFVLSVCYPKQILISIYWTCCFLTNIYSAFSIYFAKTWRKICMITLSVWHIQVNIFQVTWTRGHFFF